MLSDQEFTLQSLTCKTTKGYKVHLGNVSCRRILSSRTSHCHITHLCVLSCTFAVLSTK